MFSRSMIWKLRGKNQNEISKKIYSIEKWKTKHSKYITYQSTDKEYVYIHIYFKTVQKTNFKVYHFVLLKISKKLGFI